MTVPTGRLQFFALEAGDYLERLALLCGTGTPPDGDELVRLTRALRGTALMAGLNAFSQAASGAEQIAKAHRDGQWEWTLANTEILADAVEDLKGMVRRAPEWTDADSEAALDLGKRLVGRLGPSPIPDPAQARAGNPDELSTSVRAFIAREGALVAGSLEHAAQAMPLGPIDQAADLVLRRLQPLRGLGTLPSLTPLPDFLDAIELTLRTYRRQAAPPGGAGALRKVAGGLSDLARRIADGQDIDPDAGPLGEAASALLDVFGSEQDVVEVADLFRHGDPEPIVRSGTLPSETPANPSLELVSLADRLRQAADQLGGSTTATGRNLFLFGVLLDLRPLTHQTTNSHPALRPLLDAINGAIISGGAGQAADEFARQLRTATEILNQAAESRDAVFFAAELEPVVDELQRLQPADEPVVTDSGTIDPAIAPSQETVGDQAASVADPVVPIATLAPDPVAGMTSFERSFSTLHRLAHPTPAVASVPKTDDLDAGIVPIDRLLYQGRRALERADEVRLVLSDALRQQRPFVEIQPLVSELIDLVPLALAE